MTVPGLTQDVEHFCSTCPVCQLTKMERKKYALLPPKTAEADPLVMVCVDLAVSFTRKTPLKTHFMLALTMIVPYPRWICAFTYEFSRCKSYDLFYLSKITQYVVTILA
jgi:hypothetical protein